MRIDMVLLKNQKKQIHRKDRFLSVTGSAGSGKSIYGANKTILFALENRKAICLVVRKTLKSLKKTSIPEIKKLLLRYKISYTENKTDHVITLFNGSEIHFTGMDDLKKIRSMTVAFIWIEQAEEISYMDYMELNMRMRGIASYRQMLLTFTPDKEDLWIYKLYENDPKLRDKEIIHFSYKDNIFLPEDFYQELEMLKEIDEDAYRVYALGLPGKVKHRIYDWEERELIGDKGILFGGIDWGFNNPSAFALMTMIENEVYIMDELYKTQLTNTELIQLVKDLLTENNIDPYGFDIFYDPSEPGRAEEFAQEGFNMIPGEKKPLDRINTVKSYRVYYDPQCVNTKKEVMGYKWMVDKEDNVLDKPLKFRDHLMNAIEYAVHGVELMKREAVPEDPELVVLGDEF